MNKLSKKFHFFSKNSQLLCYPLHYYVSVLIEVMMVVEMIKGIKFIYFNCVTYYVQILMNIS